MRFLGGADNVQSRGASVNLTAMIDVIFLLIIFFLAVGDLSDLQVEADVRLAQAQTASQNDSPPPNRIVVNLTKDGKAIVAGEAVTGWKLSWIIELATKLNRDEQGRVRVDVLIRCDERTPYERVEEVLATCARFGVRSIFFKTAVAEDVEK